MTLTPKQREKLKEAKNSGAVSRLTKKSIKISGLASLNASGELTKASEIDESSSLFLSKHKPSGVQKKNNYSHSSILTVSTDEITNWKYNDRPESELGDIKNLAEDMSSNGQIQPCIVRLIKNPNYQYELIVGERRWRAAKLLNTKLKIIINDLSDKDALLIQASENENRKNLSDYAKGLHYSRIIKNGLFTQDSLAKNLSKSATYVRQLLAFSSIEPNLATAIGDLSQISSRTAYEIIKWQKKGKEQLKILTSIAPTIIKNNLGSSTLAKKIERKLQKKSTKKHSITKKYSLKNKKGETVIIWNKTNDGDFNIKISKDFVNSKKIENITETILSII
jgi:ParB family chromosome partitioning protein